MSGRKKGCCSAELFWQQDIDESLVLKKLWTKGGQWQCCLFLGILCVGLGVLLMGEAGKVQELVVEYGTKDKTKEFTLDEDFEGDVFFYYELNNFYGNYRNYVENRENNVVGSSFMKYRCKGQGQAAQTLKDITNIRGKGESSADLAKYLNPEKDIINKGPDADGQELFPCGLVAFSMFLDEYSLYKVEGTEDHLKIQMKTDEVAWKSDIDHMDAKIKEKDGKWVIADRMKPDEIFFKSWIDNDLLKQRFAVWYRTSASTTVRHLWAKIPGGLKKGKYKLTFDVNGPIWEDWNVKKSVVISTVSSTGGKGNGFIQMACIIWGAVLLLSGLCWLAAPKPVKKVSEEGDESWAQPR